METSTTRVEYIKIEQKRYCENAELELVENEGTIGWEVDITSLRKEFNLLEELEKPQSKAIFLTDGRRGLDFVVSYRGKFVCLVGSSPLIKNESEEPETSDVEPNEIIES